ncbi:MAG: hypothetical protein JWN46_3607 [Acidimicrobiales bacterium]|nr:hypothetical protein [Acidimicrobiales bacterium]
MTLFAANAWAWRPHPEVWVLMVAIIGLYLWAERTIGPKVVPLGTPPVTRAQKRYFVAGVALMWLAADWPMHDIGENYLYVVHMVQHLLLTLVVPPLLLLGTPEWLARLVLTEGRAAPWIKRMVRPVAAAAVYNVVLLLSHWPTLVNTSVRVGWLHFIVHAVLFVTALAVWTPICGPIPEWRLSVPAQMVYLFLMSVVPTLPGAWLTFSTHAVYKAYDIPQRLWGISVRSDQQAAGLLMKLGGGAYLWTIIAVLFFRWAARDEAASKEARSVAGRQAISTRN